MKKWLFPIGLTLLTLTSISGQAQQKRIALVIGAKNYTSLPPLRNSINDAKAMTSALQAKGFVVESVYDPKTKLELKEAINRYFNQMRDQVGAVGIIFYAGHGIQYEGENYIIPTSVSLQNPGDLEDCVTMNTVMKVLNASTKSLNILLLDACRSLPSFTRSSEQGLTRIDAPKGSIVVFATQPGTVASDGTGTNGLFTSKLIKVIEEPNLNITDVFKKVKQQVYQESKEAQLPSVEDNSLGGDFFFTAPSSGTVAVTVPVVEATVSTDANANAPGASELKKGKYFYSQKSYYDAIKFFRMAAGKNNPEAQAYLGQMLENGEGGGQDYKEALDWYRKSADKGNALGQNNLGSMMQYGYGTPIDLAEAAKWYRKAADQGDPKAQNNLGWLYDGGLGVPQDSTEAAKWFRKSAEQGNANSQVKLGWMTELGYGVPKNPTEAVMWYRKAAEQGNVTGQNNLGSCYRDGNGVDPDYEEALVWFRKAAEQNDTSAQTNLGWMLLFGHGTAPNYPEALRLFREAEAKGDASAQMNLGYMYENGTGVTKDIKEAIRWYKKSGNDYSMGRLAALGVK